MTHHLPSASLLANAPTLPAPPRGRVLVVDDNPGCVRALAHLLTEDGFEVVTAQNGAEAMARLREETLDALVTDLDMPLVDGFALMRFVQEHFRSLPIVVVSGGHYPAERVLRGSVVAYLGKPAPIDEVVGALDTALQLRAESAAAR